MMTDTRSEYDTDVETAAEVAIEALEEDPVEHDSIERAVEYAIDGSTRLTHSGEMLLTVYHSQHSPDDDFFTGTWRMRLNTSDVSDTRWTEVVSNMAYTCFFSDVLNKTREIIDEENLEFDHLQ